MPRDDVAAVVEAVERETGHEGVTIVSLRSPLPLLVFVVGDYRVEVVVEAIVRASNGRALVSTGPVHGAWDVASGARLAEVDV